LRRRIDRLAVQRCLWNAESRSEPERVAYGVTALFANLISSVTICAYKALGIGDIKNVTLDERRYEPAPTSPSSHRLRLLKRSSSTSPPRKYSAFHFRLFLDMRVRRCRATSPCLALAIYIYNRYIYRRGHPECRILERRLGNTLGQPSGPAPAPRFTSRLRQRARGRRRTVVGITYKAAIV
jgi:hypothetical protein